MLEITSLEWWLAEAAGWKTAPAREKHGGILLWDVVWTILV